MRWNEFKEGGTSWYGGFNDLGMLLVRILPDGEIWKVLRPPKDEVECYFDTLEHAKAWSEKYIK
jgi:hypothetical protein